MTKEKWIEDMKMKKGSLHKQLNVSDGKKIPTTKLREAASKGGLEAKRANLAMTLKGLKK